MPNGVGGGGEAGAPKAVSKPGQKIKTSGPKPAASAKGGAKPGKPTAKPGKGGKLAAATKAAISKAAKKTLKSKKK